MSNLFAVGDQDPGFLDELEQRLRGDPAGSRAPHALELATGAEAPLPESEPHPEATRRGFAFAHGRDRLEANSDLRWLDRLEDVVDRRPTSLDELPGDFGFLRFSQNGGAKVIRSCGGLAPLYLRRHRGGFATGTLLRYFTRYLPGPFSLDAFVAVTWPGTAALIDGRTFVEGIEILPRGSVTTLSLPAARQTQVYWDPRPAPGARLVPSPEHPRRLRRLLMETLARDLDPRGGNLLFLSGGVDSTSLAALAAGTLGKPLASLSIVPPPAATTRPREMSFIDPVVERFGIEPAITWDMSVEFHRRVYESLPGMPFLIGHPAFCELPRLQAEHGFRVILAGEFADDVCGEINRITDWARHVPPWRLLRTRDLPFGPRDRERWARRRLLDLIRRPAIPFPQSLLPWVSPAFAAEYREWRRRRQVERARDRRPLGELADQASGDGWLAMQWEGTTPLGIRRSIPFFTREVLELAFECHPTELLGPGKKRLLRAALADDVLQRNLMRPDKGQWGEGFLDNETLTIDRDVPASISHAVREDWQPRPPAEAPYGLAISLLSLIRFAERFDEQGATAESQGPATAKVSG
jgi:asparagine synthetase B (glutamine-hydrolysing)